MSIGRRVLIIVQNLPVPLDRRVWLECQALIARGYAVSVICPKGPGDPSRQTLDGVAIYKYRPAPEAKGVGGFIVEFVYSWLRTALLSLRVWRDRGFDIIQACNPPDTYWLLARLWRIRGVKFIFDHHDLNPELYLSRFGKPSSFGGRVQLNGLLWLERMTFRAAHRVISTNESYKKIAISRGHRRADEVTVVRSGPDTQLMRPIYPPPSIRRNGRYLLVYLGIMGPQDGVDVVLEVMDELVNWRGRTDVHAALLGFGDCFEDLRRQSTQLGLDDYVTFTGRADKGMIADYLSAADIGMCPDRKTPLNDISTMNKTMEYMAYALPSVSFDLAETRVSGAEAVLYVTPGDVKAFADSVARLLDDAELRATMSLRARGRVVKELDWRPQAEKYVGVYDELVGRESGLAAESGTTLEALRARTSIDEERGQEFVDLDDADELRRFVLERSAPQ
ncbi:glycosyltransferase involved in cell wall biosynthesis [Antricoccus suffuscus]|uniref:Glycosyltransferase involved in cell wall biosynthesis n=1 Tax=Antricoccus suffuscus TaxID=1629062 RepID=A0A2T1A1K4_9ACTN|nr:glycosyltransferase family 4 protein [Antricoccus suffuscus]PRZ42482.1 glycosyltransferase involved in cell wall biosynthesis [Antricoccus suffuscus]